MVEKPIGLLSIAEADLVDDFGLVFGEKALEGRLRARLVNHHRVSILLDLRYLCSFTHDENNKIHLGLEAQIGHESSHTGQ